MRQLLLQSDRSRKVESARVTKVKVKIERKEIEVEAGTSLQELLVGDRAERRVVAALLNNRLVSLNTQIHHPVQVAPVHRDSLLAKSVLVRSSHHVLYTALNHCFPELLAEVGQSLPHGYYHAFLNAKELGLASEVITRTLETECNRLVRDDLPFEALQVPIEAVEDFVQDPHRYREGLLGTWPTPYVSLIRLNGFADLQHGPYVPSTGYLGGISLKDAPRGLVLELKEMPPDPPRERLLVNCYFETRAWNRALGVGTVGELNTAILEGRISEVVRVSEAFHEKKIAQIADAICQRSDQVRMVCIAGPSSAGKTTFVRRLRVQMLVNGVVPVELGLDDYYRPRVEMPKGSDGLPDFESLSSIDTELLSDHLTRLCNGEEVARPKYDFASGRRVNPEQWEAVKLMPNQVLMVEGLHGLNPGLAPQVGREAKFLIFVNALTQLLLDEHNRMPTSKARLLRRLVRDRRFRGSPASETLSLWPKVRTGEVEYIFPFQGEADTLFNSSLVYEAAVLRNLAWRYLLEVGRSDPHHSDAYQLLKFLELFIPIEESEVPSTSVLREFLGGSTFAY